MLSEYDKELLTAFVDGEMSRRQRKAVLRLLHQSSEARAFLQELQENAHLFKQLPHHKLGDRFAGDVLSEIAARGLKPKAPKSAVPVRRRVPLWLGAGAATVLLAVGIWYGLLRSRDAVDQPNHDITKLVIPEAPRKVSMPFADLAVPERREVLRKELARESTVKVDLAVRDGTNAVRRFMQVLKDNKFDLVESPVARMSIKKNTPKTQYVVYAEGVQAEEVLTLLQQAGNEAKGTGQGGFEALVVTSLDPQARQQLTDLGVNVQQSTSSGPDTTRPKSKMPGLPNPERFAVVLTNAAESGTGFAPDVQEFLKSRRELRPGTMQVLVVLTPAVA